MDGPPAPKVFLILSWAVSMVCYSFLLIAHDLDVNIKFLSLWYWLMYTMYFFTDVLLNPNEDSTTVIAKIKEMPRSLFFVTMGYIYTFPSCTMRNIRGCYLKNHVNYMKFHISLFCCSWLFQNNLHGVIMLLETQKSNFFIS